MRALITGVTGQDGSYLAEVLAEKSYQVFGMIRGQQNPKREWIQRLVPEIELVDGDLLDQSSLIHVLDEVQPDVIFNMAALTYVGMSWHQPALMSEVTGLGPLRLLEALRLLRLDARVVQASSSEQFGASPPPQDENTRFHPRSPYGVAKTFAHQTMINYRESYGIPISTAIMFNHSSPRRGKEFVERKISLGACAIRDRRQSALHLGNLAPQRDLGWAPEYMELVARIADGPPDDYVIGTGHMTSVREMARYAFELLGLNYSDHVVEDPRLHRPAEVEQLQANTTKVRHTFNWTPKWTFKRIMEELIHTDYRP